MQSRHHSDSSHGCLLLFVNYSLDPLAYCLRAPYFSPHPRQKRVTMYMKVSCALLMYGIMALSCLGDFSGDDTFSGPFDGTRWQRTGSPGTWYHGTRGTSAQKLAYETDTSNSYAWYEWQSHAVADRSWDLDVWADLVSSTAGVFMQVENGEFLRQGVQVDALSSAQSVIGTFTCYRHVFSEVEFLCLFSRVSRESPQ